MAANDTHLRVLMKKKLPELHPRGHHRSHLRQDFVLPHMKQDWKLFPPLNAHLYFLMSGAVLDQVLLMNSRAPPAVNRHSESEKLHVLQLSCNLYPSLWYCQHRRYLFIVRPYRRRQCCRNAGSTVRNSCPCAQISGLQYEWLCKQMFVDKISETAVLVHESW